MYAWDLSKQQPRILKGHKTKITSIVYEEHSNNIVTSSADATVKIWDLRAPSDKATITFTGHQDVVKDIAVSPDGRWVSSGGADGLVKIWEVDTGKIIREFH